ncbi:LysR family transcriptional regulator [Roseovarius sp. EL26]|uniref:LysR family transcriptional regulator n=1 Tax=Roseovarius sp. EL26 TaxID=2126672 RepID=UPI000EA24FC9|nr:LysR family transcriptional regulator [Roseovarius sp. EL26]
MCKSIKSRAGQCKNEDPTAKWKVNFLQNGISDHPRLQDADLKLLHVFAHVVEAGGLSSAQYSLNMSLPAISAAISNLEARLGFRLCDRGRSGFKLTEGGHLVVSQIKPLSNALSQFEKSIDAFRGDLRGQIKIAMDDAILTNLRCPIYKVIRKFSTLAPDVDFNIVLMNAPQMERALLNNELNLAVGPFREVSSALDSVVIYNEMQLLCCGSTHAAFGIENKDELAAIVSSSKFSARNFDDSHKETRPTIFAKSATVATVEAMLGMVLSGAYLGYLPRHACEHWIDQNEIWPLLPEIYSYGTDIKIVYHRVSNDKRVDMFLKALTEVQAID